MSPFNTLKIIDRVKNIFKLSQGEYIAPEKLEIVYSQALSVQQIFVTGDSTKNYPVAVVVPDFDYLARHLNKTRNQIIQDEESKKFVWSEMMEKAASSNLNSLEKIQQLELIDEEFTQENELLTPTMKIKRPAARQYFKEVVERLYTLPIIS